MTDLVLQEPGMTHHVMVEDEIIGKRGEEEVKDVDPKEGDDGDGDDLSGEVVSGPCGGGC